MGALMMLRAAFVVAILLLAFIGLLWVTRSLSTGRRPPQQERPPEEIPLEILRRRYAAGEIDEDEFLRRLSGLSQR